eukprot:comp22490_c0_seq2/m.55887 comp22490_c0_seq2/g.55887  ORF comp22490_c0_seq2/g.55887 comp22490_c0_seq2/m.55887 type:complete len:139 (-) comp22490_c0_seq2:326-742(-)
MSAWKRYNDRLDTISTRVRATLLASVRAFGPWTLTSLDAVGSSSFVRLVIRMTNSGTWMTTRQSGITQNMAASIWAQSHKIAGFLHIHLLLGMAWTSELESRSNKLPLSKELNHVAEQESILAISNFCANVRLLKQGF